MFNEFALHSEVAYRQQQLRRLWGAPRPRRPTGHRSWLHPRRRRHG